ncbi:hypothetical protein FE257_003323 [Aspergillus nanangensis]|uniref:AAA+ ATPase domain-containing protein n=1 Tax=Aspergillus nanangensis TaxID=2582783 RepID=A0AAD4GXQ8_ASPNN|nr:hypothetical protein FE257_003323 [Aspergillus nanangensis]
MDENASNGQPPKEEPATGEERPGVWYRHTVERRERSTNELISRQDVPSHKDEEISQLNGPVFDFVKTLRVRQATSTDRNPVADSALVSLVAPEYHIQIHSPAVINALQSVVEYYPQQDLGADPLIVKWPYALLVHHYDNLKQFRKDCAEKDPEELCIREKDAHEHIGLVLEFLDKQVMEQVNAEKDRIRRGFQSFEWAWVSHKPGTTVMERLREDNHWTPGVVHSISGGVFQNPPIAWTVQTWTMNYDGEYLGRMTQHSYIEKYDGELDRSQFTRFYNDLDAIETDELSSQRIKKGEAYWKLLKKQCRYYKGPTTVFPYNDVDGLVMADLVSYYTHTLSPKPILMDISDCRNWSSDCECSICKGKRAGQQRNLESRFEDYNLLTLESNDKDLKLEADCELTPHQYLLCPAEIPAYVFKTRTWETLHVANFAEPQFSESLINSLVMDSGRLQTLKALAKSFSRINKSGDEMKKPPWAADFVKGKGHGMIFLLHGRPGVGKTCTAECIAEYIRRPLMTLSCSDIGTDPNVVEGNLIRNFKTARSWDAVLLIDEADVFMERRSTADLTRNSLVAGFLRALEFYDGLLFLTTNRVGSFDDAFMSRVHVQLYYSDFSDEERQLVWKTFTDKLARERGDYIRLNIDAKEYIRGAEVRALEWNGREIRNAFQTAVALAEFEADKDEENKIVINDSHLRAVVQLSSDFKRYLNTLHQGNEGKRAERKQYHPYPLYNPEESVDLNDSGDSGEFEADTWPNRLDSVFHEEVCPVCGGLFSTSRVHYTQYPRLRALRHRGIRPVKVLGNAGDGGPAWRVLFRMIIYDPTHHRYHISGVSVHSESRWFSIDANGDGTNLPLGHIVPWNANECNIGRTDRNNPAMAVLDWFNLFQKIEEQPQLTGYPIHMMCWDRLSKIIGHEAAIENLGALSHVLQQRWQKMRNQYHRATTWKGNTFNIRLFEERIHYAVTDTPFASDYVREMINLSRWTAGRRRLCERPKFLKPIDHYHQQPVPWGSSIDLFLRSLSHFPARQRQSPLTSLPVEIQYMIMDYLSSKQALIVREEAGWMVPESYWAQRINTRAFWEVNEVSALEKIDLLLLCFRLEHDPAASDRRRWLDVMWKIQGAFNRRVQAVSK